MTRNSLIAVFLLVVFLGAFTCNAQVRASRPYYGSGYRPGWFWSARPYYYGGYYSYPTTYGYPISTPSYVWHQGTSSQASNTKAEAKADKIRTEALTGCVTKMRKAGQRNISEATNACIMVLRLKK